MIELVVLLAAAAGGAAVARWVRRDTKSSIEKSRAKRKEQTPAKDDLGDGLVALGDVIVLDGGRGVELWLVRRVAFREQADGDPFLVLFEAYAGRTRPFGFVAWQPLRGDVIDVLSRRDLGAPVGGDRSSRPPSTLEVDVEDERVVVSLEMRRTARVAMRSLEPARDFESALPHDGATSTVALYGGGPHVRALVVRGEDGERFYVGKTLARDAIEILRNRDASPAR